MVTGPLLSVIDAGRRDGASTQTSAIAQGVGQRSRFDAGTSALASVVVGSGAVPGDAGDSSEDSGGGAAGGGGGGGNFKQQPQMEAEAGSQPEDVTATAAAAASEQRSASMSAAPTQQASRDSLQAVQHVDAVPDAAEAIIGNGGIDLRRDSLLSIIEQLLGPRQPVNPEDQQPESSAAAGKETASQPRQQQQKQQIKTEAAVTGATKAAQSRRAALPAATLLRPADAAAGALTASVDGSKQQTGKFKQQSDDPKAGKKANSGGGVVRAAVSHIDDPLAPAELLASQEFSTRAQMNSFGAGNQYGWTRGVAEGDVVAFSTEESASRLRGGSFGTGIATISGRTAAVTYVPGSKKKSPKQQVFQGAPAGDDAAVVPSTGSGAP